MTNQPTADWTSFLSALALALVRLSGMVAFAPFFSSTALPVRTRAVFVGAVGFLVAPLVAALPRSTAAAQASTALSFSALVGELAVGLVYGLTLTLLTEMMLFAGQIVGLQFSFSAVNLLDPTSAIQTPLLGDLFQLMGTLVVIAAGLDRIGATSSAALPVLLVPSPARYHVKRWLEPVLPRLAVIAAGEIPPEIRLRPVGTVR